VGAQNLGDALVRHWATLVDINTPDHVAADQLSGIKQAHRDSLVNAFAIAAAGAETAGIDAVEAMFARRLCVLGEMADALPTVLTKAGEVFGEGTVDVDVEAEVYRSWLINSLHEGFDWWRKALE
jgi:hypothetical protein